MKIDKYHIFPFGKSHLIYPDIENNPHLFAFGDEEPATTFISLSGGIDSTYTLYEWLYEAEEKLNDLYMDELDGLGDPVVFPLDQAELEGTIETLNSVIGLLSAK